jgi:hypothetical protein
MEERRAEADRFIIGVVSGLDDPDRDRGLP